MKVCKKIAPNGNFLPFIILIISLILYSEYAKGGKLPDYPEKFPRLATLWNHGSINQKASFDLIVYPIHRIWPVNHNKLMMSEIKDLNPDILSLGYFHATNIMMDSYFKMNFFDDQIIDYCWVLTHTGSHQGYGGTVITGNGISPTDKNIPVKNNHVFSPNQFLLIQNYDQGYEMLQVASDWKPEQKENVVRVKKRGIYNQSGTFSPRSHSPGTRIASIAVPFSGSYGKARAEFNCTRFCRRSRITGETWIEFISRDITHKMLHNKLDKIYDGVFLDNAGRHAVSSFRQSIAITEEAESDNRPDYNDEEWKKGIFLLYEKLKDMMSDKIILANKGYEGYGRIDGAMMEHYHFDYSNRTNVECHYDNWYRYDKKMDLPLKSSGLFIFNAGGKKQEKDYRAMRFGLTRCLMRNGYFLFDDTLQGHHSKMWWFDEFDNSGKGKGYLGPPLGEMKHILCAKMVDSGNLLDLSVLATVKSGNNYTYMPSDTLKQWRLSSTAEKIPHLTLFFEFKGKNENIFSVTIPGSKVFIDQLKCTSEWQKFQFCFDAKKLTRPDVVFDFKNIKECLNIRNIKLIPKDLRFYRRDYKNGVVFHNGTGRIQAVSLGKAYKKINGKQDPEINNGKIVKKVEVPPNDGIILLNIDHEG